MEELIEYINDYKVNLLDTKTQNVLRNVRNIAENLLEKEKRIIVDAFDDARKKQTETIVTGENKDDCFYVITNKFENGEQYYSQTFKKD